MTGAAPSEGLQMSVYGLIVTMPGIARRDEGGRAFNSLGIQPEKRHECDKC